VQFQNPLHDPKRDLLKELAQTGKKNTLIQVAILGVGILTFAVAITTLLRL
jgi:hypothetical protein